MGLGQHEKNEKPRSSASGLLLARDLIAHLTRHFRFTRPSLNRYDPRTLVDRLTRSRYTLRRLRIYIPKEGQA